MRIARVWALAAGLAFLGLIAGKLQAQTQPAVTDESQVAGESQIARWDVVLNDTGLDAVKQIDAPIVPSRSQVYQAMACDAAMLRGAVAQAAATGGLEGAGQSMGFTFQQTQQMNRQLYFNYMMTRQSRVQLNGQAMGKQEDEDADGGRIHLTLDYPRLNLQIEDMRRGRENGSVPAPASLQYEGTLAPGDAVAFLGTFKTGSGISYHHLIVWEVFKAENWQAQYFQELGDGGWWVDNGPEGMRALANTAVVWASRAAHPFDQVPAGFEQKLSDGKVVRLEAICRQDKWPFCWWDGAGQPVMARMQAYLNQYSLKNGPQCNIGVEGGKEEWAMQSPPGSRSSGMDLRGDSIYQQQQQFAADKSGNISVGIPVGKWEQIGQVDMDGTIAVDGVTFRVSPGGRTPTMFFVGFYPTAGAPPTDLIALTAVMKDGSELAPAFLNQITAKNYGAPGMQFMGQQDQLKIFHVWRRKRDWVTFDHLLSQPVDTPKQNVTAQEVAAAQSIVQRRESEISQKEIAGQIKMIDDKRKEWDAIAPDPANAKGAIRLLVTASEKGDVAAVRHRLTASGSDAGPLLDLMARQITDVGGLRVLAIQRFGEPALAQSKSYWLLFGFQTQLLMTQWQPRSDGGLESPSASVVKGSDGQFYVDLSNMKGGISRPQMEAGATQLIKLAETVSQALKDDPNMTADQFEKTVTLRPKAKPATQTSGG